MKPIKRHYVFLLIVVLIGTFAAWILIGRFIFPLPDADFSADYTSVHRDQVTVIVPEMYELANIIIAITDYGLEDPFRVLKSGEYYQEVIDHFSPYRDHPLIADLDFSDKTFDRYIRFRENSFANVFDGNKIVHSPVYSSVQIPNWFEKHRASVEDFARVSGFRDFYRDHEVFYQAQIASYKAQVPLEEIWIWLEKRFPVRVDSYKVVFSPLIGASHTTRSFVDDAFHEAVMFIAGPDFFSKAPEELEAALLTRLIFTEIDHNYVNPVSKEFNTQISGAFGELDLWNEQSSYRSPQMTFNEYMTWSVYLLYAYEHYPTETYNAVRRSTITTMVSSRGFVRFEEFSDRLLEQYLEQEDRHWIPDLYPRILGWAKSYTP